MPFKAIIVGGSITGQALALQFEKGNIDYVLLEGRPAFAMDQGASVALFPNGLRILDQLGLFEKISATSIPMETGVYRDQTGQARVSVHFFRETKALEYHVRRADRQVQTLGNKAVVSIEENESGVKVTTSDGSVYEGDIVIGADCVWSRVREHMWSQMEKAEKPPAELQEDRSALFCDYSCLFGISDPVKGVDIAHATIVYRSGDSFLLAAGKGATVYWFYFHKLPERCKAPNIPRFTEQDTIDSAENVLDAFVTDTVTFGELWRNRKSAIKVPMEETVFKKWHYGRTVIIGDSAHKFSANFGMGANQAIESATVLTNALYEKLQKKPDGPDLTDIDAAFTEFQANRFQHINGVYQAAYDTTRMEAMDGLKCTVIGRYLMPPLGESLRLALVKSIMITAPSLKFLDKPTKPHAIPYNDELPERQSGWFS
ncbi:hypothetical protein Unana1_00866 [Umbelopsis nana]